MKEIHCVWCGEIIESVADEATMDTCEDCEEYFEENIPQITKSLNKILLENEALNISDDDKKEYALRSYSLITAIHMLSSKPAIEFKDSKYLKFL